MPDNPLQLLAHDSCFAAEMLNRPTVVRSTVVVWPASPYTGMAEGEVVFVHGLRLRMREELDFATGLITSYGYDVYRDNERLYWYDDFPHPQGPSLAATFPSNYMTSEHSTGDRGSLLDGDLLDCYGRMVK